MQWGRVSKYVLGKAGDKWKANGWGLPFGGQRDNEYMLRVMMWADNYWLFCHNEERLIRMVNDIIEELLDLDCKDEEKNTLQMGSRTRTWELPFREVFEVLECRHLKNGKGFQGAERTMCEGLGSWWHDKYIHLWRPPRTSAGKVGSKNPPDCRLGHTFLREHNREADHGQIRARMGGWKNGCPKLRGLRSLDFVDWDGSWDNGNCRPAF